MTAAVRYLDAEPNGLATMVGGLIESNLSVEPAREALLRQRATYAITITDVRVSVSLEVGPDGVSVRSGDMERPDVRIETSSETLIGLSSVPLRFGLPDLTSERGREVFRKMLKGELKVKGMWSHPGKLARLNKLLTVRDQH